jgi:glycosyltransferase involved in cell wall biosynthesis
MARNLSTATGGAEWWGSKPAKAYSLTRPRRVMSVENGAGFGGAVVALETLLEGLSPADVEVHVISNYGVGRFATLPVVREHKVIRDRRVNFSRIADAITSSGEVQSWSRAVLFLLGRLDDVVNRLPYLVALLREVYRIRPDIIHGNNTPLSNREAIIAASLAGIPYIQHVRGPLEPGGGQRWLLRGPSAFVAVSKWLEQTLVARGVEHGRIRQIYDALPTPKDVSFHRSSYFRSEIGIPGDADVVAMVGMLLPWKGQRLFLDAVAQIAERFPRAYFLLIGGTPKKSEETFERELRQAIHSMKLSNRVLMTGMRNDVVELLREVDAVVSASMDPEPLGLVMLEGMLAGKVFIGPAHGAAVEVIEHGVNGLLFRPRDADSLAEVLGDFLSSSCSSDAIGERARADVMRRFKQAQQAELFAAQLATLLASAKR